MNLEKDVNFETLVHMIPDNFTGADFYGLTSQAVLLAVKRKIAKINKLYGLIYNDFYLFILFRKKK